MAHSYTPTVDGFVYANFRLTPLSPKRTRPPPLETIGVIPNNASVVDRISLVDRLTEDAAFVRVQNLLVWRIESSSG